MSRTARKQSESGFYHVVARGTGHQVIFESQADRDFFIEKLKEYKQVCGVELHAYCLMDNHFHLLIKCDAEKLVQFMRRLNTSYSMHYNGRYAHTGHLFQGRYKSEPVDGDAYYLMVLRYIVQNPLKAGMGTAAMRSLSSFNSYFSKNGELINRQLPIDLCDGEDALRQFLLTQNDDTCMDVLEHKFLTDDELRRIICETAHVPAATHVKGLPKRDRDEVIRIIVALGVSERRIERETGVGRSIIRRIKQNG